MAHLPGSTGSSAHLERPAATLTSDTVVFSHTKAPSRQSSVVAGTASTVLASSAACRGVSRRLTVRVIKHGNTLGFGVRRDRHKRLQVSTLQGGDSQLRVGDTLLSVNGVDLTKQEFLTVIQQLKATRPGELVFEIERGNHRAMKQQVEAQGATSPIATPAAAGGGVLASTTKTENPWGAASVPAVAVTVAGAGASTPACWQQNEAQQTAIGGKNLPAYVLAGMVPQTGVPPPSIPVTAGRQANGAQQPRKRARPAQRAVTMLDDNGQPVNVTALLADIKKERANKAALEEKNAGLRKRLQRMLIENDEVRVRAKNEVVAAQEKAKREIAEAQNQLAAARAQIRLQDRGPDVGRTDSIINELVACKAQLERLKKAEAERTALLTTRYRGECRVASADAQRVLDSVVGMFRAKLRQAGRMSRDSSSKPELEVACDGVRRLAFMKLFRMAHDFAFYTSATFHSSDPVRHTLEQEQFADLFGNSLCHEERAGLFYVATAPMLVVFDPSAESIVFTCEWAEQNAIRELARNFRF
ncbi:hypothetical protein PRNP1_006876 [Phytophthora ramorum]